MTKKIDNVVTEAAAKVEEQTHITNLEMPGFIETTKLVFKAPFQGAALVGLLGGTLVSAGWNSRGLMTKSANLATRMGFGILTASLMEASTNLFGGDCTKMSDEQIVNNCRNNWK